MNISPAYISFQEKRFQKKVVNPIALVVIGLLIALVAQSVKVYVNLPEVKRNPDRVCVRVVASDGSQIKDGCKLVQKGKIQIYKTTYVAK